MDRYLMSYQDKQYPVMEVTIFKDTPDERDIIVATTDLEDRLLHDMDAQSSVAKEATELDENIAYYVEPEEIRLSCEDIAKIVEASY